jgi:hypothetical protein
MSVALGYAGALLVMVIMLVWSRFDRDAVPRLPDGPREPLEPDPPTGPIADVAARFDLKFRDGVARGTVRSVDVALRSIEENGRRTAYELTTTVSDPLELELDIRPGKTSLPIEFVSPGFDSSLAVHSRDMARAGALLRGGAGDDLLRAALEPWRPVLESSRLSFTLPPDAHARDLRRAVELLVTVARRLQTSAVSTEVHSEPVRDPVEQRAFVNWRVLADRWNAELLRDPVVLEVPRPVTLRVRLLGRRSGGFKTRVELAPARPFSTSMELVKTDRLPKHDPRRENDIIVGTRELDEGFVITGERGEVLDLLTLQAQAALVALGTRCTEVEVLPNVLAALCLSVEGVATELLPDAHHGAYR